MNVTEISLRKMTQSDLDLVVDIHYLAFKGFFLTFLGPGFLYELYRFIIDDPSSIAIVAVDNVGKLLGFVAGTTSPHGFYSRAVRKRVMKFALASLPSFIKRPAILPRLFRAFGKLGTSSANYDECELMSIAVLPELNGHGLGSMLELSFSEEARSNGSKIIKLTTDSEMNDSVNQFYINRGYCLYKTFTTPENRRMNLYKKKLFDYGEHY